MTRALIRHRFLLWIVTALLLLGGGLGLAFILIGKESSRADDLAAEANLRGNAVATLAGDVRALREQVKAHGGTPVVPDPTKAVPSLSARAEVPVPIPGPPGPSGAVGAIGPSGAPGSPGTSGAPGQTGASGRPGADSTVAGPAGPAGPAGAAGQDGKDGRDGVDGANGQPPAGWTFTYNGVTYTCSPVSDFDESDPQYACTSDEPSSPSLPVDPSASLLVGCAALRRRDGRGRGARGRHRAVRHAGGAHR